MKTYVIYMHKNKINGKVYIGQTCQKPEYRWNHGEGYINCSYFYRAIKKYGWDSFEHIILEENLSFEEANEKEQYFISLYKANQEQFGYNLQSGGSNHQVSNITREKCKQNSLKMWENEEHKKHMSQVMKEKWKEEEYRNKQKQAKKNNPHTISEDGRKRISEARKKYIQEHGTPTQGIGHTEETKEKIRQSKLGEKNPMYGKHHTEEQKQKVREKLSKKVQCIETGQIFTSRAEAAQWCGLASGSSISANLSGKKKSAGKHPETGEKLHWKNID